MKLKTKFQDEDFDLGEVVEANVYYGGSRRIKVITESTKGVIVTFYFESLKGLNEMFEDYEEPKRDYYYIDYNGTIKCFQYLDFDWQEEMKQIGNYFETREEAEKAVEKLKAWKRLKDKNFHFLKYSALGCGEIEFSLDFEDMDDEGEIGELQHDLDLLFGGEE